MPGRPTRDDVAEYYFRYIDQVPDGLISSQLANQLSNVVPLLTSVSEDRSLHRYAPGKWSMRDVIAHCSDAERLFQARAFWFARGFDTALPSFDEHISATAAQADHRSWTSLIDELSTVRASSVAFFAGLPAEAWERRGIASGFPFTVNALAYLAVGHLNHHVRVLRERYLGQ